MIKITKTIEWEMGHRIPNHNSKCKNPHGHHYRLELTLSGNLGSISGSSSEGMVIDFEDVKEILSSTIYKPLDHGFMVYECDNVMCNFFNANKEEAFKVIRVPFIPTVENICKWCFDTIQHRIPANITITNVRVYETPYSWADITPSAHE